MHGTTHSHKFETSGLLEINACNQISILSNIENKQAKLPTIDKVCLTHSKSIKSKQHYTTSFCFLMFNKNQKRKNSSCRISDALNSPYA